MGPFQVYVDPNMYEVTHFCLPHLLPVLKSTVRYLYEIFEYFETILATQFPFTCYKQVGGIYKNNLFPQKIVSKKKESNGILKQCSGSDSFYIVPYPA